MIKRIALVALLALFGSALGGWIRGGNSISVPSSFTPAWRTVAMGGGGAQTGIHFYSDGTILTKGDTSSAWSYNTTTNCVQGGTTYAPPCWNQDLTAKTLPASLVTQNAFFALYGGANEYVAAPSHTATRYMVWAYGQVLVSTNSGRTWVYDNFTTPTSWQPNGGNSPRQSDFMAVDPANPDIVYLATPLDGTYYTTNGTAGATATWTKVTTIPNSTLANGNSGGSVKFDPTSSTATCSTKTATQGIYISAMAHGVYHSTNGGQFCGGSFALASTGTAPLNVGHLNIDKFGQVWAFEGFNTSGGGVAYQYYVLQSGTWTQTTTTATGSNLPWMGVAFDPNTGGSVGSNHIVFWDTNGNITISLNNGSTWNVNLVGNNIGKQSVSPQPAWLSAIFQGSPLGLSAGFGAGYDPSGNLWITTGVDSAFVPNPIVSNVVQAPPLTWTYNVLGQDQLVNTQILGPPGVAPFFGWWDQGLSIINNVDSVKSTTVTWPGGLSSMGTINGAWGLDYVAGQVGFLVATVSQSGSAIVYSSDGGNAWSIAPQTGLTPGATGGGQIAASTTSNVCVIPGEFNTGFNVIYCSTNFGPSATWSKANVNSNATPLALSATIGAAGSGYPNPNAATATIGSAGSGYTNGSQTITVSGGTCTQQPQFTVTVASNIFTGTPTLLTAGNCTTHPSNPAATTGGGGAGGTLNLTWGGTVALTVSGGTCTTQPQFLVNISNSNVLTGTPALQTLGFCTVLPSNPVATTGGGGSGGTLNVTWQPTPFITGNIAQQQNAQPMCADRVTAGTFYAVDQYQLFYRSTDSGATWAKSTPTVDAGGTAQLYCVPGNAGHVFFVADANLWKSTDGAQTFSKPNTNFATVYGIGFGAPKPGGSGYPMIYAYGLYSGVYGFYASADAGVTWTILNVPGGGTLQQFPYDQTDIPTRVAGDMNYYGRVYVGFGTGSGGTYIDTADACPYVNFTPSFKPGQTITGTVSLTASYSGTVPVTNVNFYYDSTNLIGTQTVGSGTPIAYTQSFNTSVLSAGAHTLTVSATGANCPTANQVYNSFTIPIVK